MATETVVKVQIPVSSSLPIAHAPVFIHDEGRTFEAMVTMADFPQAIADIVRAKPQPNAYRAYFLVRVRECAHGNVSIDFLHEVEACKW